MRSVIISQTANGWLPHMNTYLLYEDEKSRDTSRAALTGPTPGEACAKPLGKCPARWATVVRRP